MEIKLACDTDINYVCFYARRYVQRNTFLGTLPSEVGVLTNLVTL